MLTYGDGVGNVDLKALLAFHKQHGKLVTVTASRPIGRFGALRLGPDNRVEKFQEKAEGDNAWINAGFFVMEPKVMDYITGDGDYFEREPLENLATDGQLVAYPHNGFWHPMDTLRDKNILEQLWQKDPVPWKVWK